MLKVLNYYVEFVIIYVTIIQITSFFRKRDIMDFMYSYKRLEKICSEIYNTNEKPVKAYIEDMKNKPRGSYLVKGWDKDLKDLDHYRWVRNQISHNPECSEENMCTDADTEWIDNFHSRIMNRTDPLSLYRKAVKSRSASQKPSQKQKKKSGSTSALTIVLIALLAIIAVLIVLYFSDFTTLPV